ncbi:MAG: efflux RND transporter periplasmic adaptor subunit [bacterium]|nr:efflux RND transporter periplasmic adaptor subunit [bacterium]
MTDSDLSPLVRDGGRESPAPHPKTEIPRPRMRLKTRIVIPGVVLLATVGLLGSAASDALRPATAVRVVPALVKTDAKAQPTGTVVVQAPGWVEPDPFPTAVSALADGVVEEVLVLEGGRVERGQIVARLVAEDARIALNHADAVLAERRAVRASAQAALEEAQCNWTHPIELTRKLRTAEARLAERRAELARWPSELAREDARAVHLRAEYERIAPLYEGGESSNIELIRARQAHEAQRAEVESVRRRQPILQAQVRSIEAEVIAAKDDLRLRILDTRALTETSAGVDRAEAAVGTAQALLDAAALRMERMEVRAAAGGVVMTRLVEPGSKLMLNMDNPRSAQVLRLYDPAKLQVRVDIPLVDAAKVGVGQPAEVIVDVLPDRSFRGWVTRVVHEADVQKNTLQVKVAIESPSPEIKPEMLARARFLAMPDADAVEDAVVAQRLFVPRTAVRKEQGQAFVWLADQVDKLARRRSVTLGRVVLEDWVAVVDGLQPGDRVIVNAPPGLEDSQRIRLLED